MGMNICILNLDRSNMKIFMGYFVRAYSTTGLSIYTEQHNMQFTAVLQCNLY